MFIAIVLSAGRADAEPQSRDLPRALLSCWDTEPCPDFHRSLLWPSYADAIAQGDHTRTADILALVELYAFQFLKNPHRADAERGEGVVRAVLIPAGEDLLPRVIQLVLRGTPVVLLVYEPANFVPVRGVATRR